MRVPIAVWQPCELLCTCYLLTYLPMCRQQTSGWDASLSDDVVRECARHGAAVTHIAVDRSSAQGNVYIKCESVTAALAAVNALHGRYFDGRLVTVAYVPSDVYHSLFPGAAAETPAAASTALASATRWRQFGSWSVRQQINLRTESTRWLVKSLTLKSGRRQWRSAR